MICRIDLSWNRSLSEVCLSKKCIGRKGSLISFRFFFSWKHSHLGRGQADRDPSRNVHLVRHASGMHLYQWLLLDVCHCQSTGWCTCGTVVSFSRGKSAELLSSFILLVWADFHEQLTEECCSACRVAGSHYSQDSRGRNCRQQSPRRAQKYVKQPAKAFYSLTFLNHCSSLEPCAPNCEWGTLIIDTAWGDWFLWSRDQVGRRTLQVPFGPQWKDRTCRQNLPQTVSQLFCMTLFCPRNAATSWIMTDILYMEHLLCSTSSACL